ncbi:MAG: DegT/DnrJ/EryC1/StrS family aminotransferase [Chloroflexi bacterium]|nr:DegT/DnrJ/EryC1/StrS family aminotransferase [Chloroflexota bacterium]
MTTNVPLVDLQAQYASIKPEVDAAIQRVLNHCGFIMGPEVQAFEEAFAAYCGTEQAVGVATGTAALHLALLACGVGPGDEVITTPFTFFASGEAISQTGARPVFVDIDPLTYNIDPQRIAAAITPRTKAIMPVHLYGQPAEMDAILDIARQHHLRVVEDAAQAHGAAYRGRRAGSLGDLACFSFYPSKNLGCYGDGGLVVGSDAELIGHVRKLRDHGRVSKYEHDELGWGYRLDALQAAILGVKLRYLDEWNAARRAHAERYDELFADTEVITPTALEHIQHIYHCYVIRTPRRDELIEHLKAEGVGVVIHYPLPLHLQPAYKGLGYRRGDFPISEACAREVLSLPLYPELTNEQQERVAESVKAFVG